MNFILGWMLIISGMLYLVSLFAKPIIMRKKVLECEKGLKLNIESKEELLQRFRDLNCFLIKQVYYNQNGDVEVIGNAGKHIFLLENGVVKSAGISSVSERKIYKLVIEEKAMLDFLAKEENPALPINPYTGYKFGKNLGMTQTISGCTALITLVLAVFFGFIPEMYIDMVKTATPDSYPNVTYEEAFENYFANSEWSSFSSDKGQIVEFTGDFYYFDAEAEACFQYVVDLESSSFSLQYFGINDVSQSMLMAGIVLEEVFSSYDSFGEEIIQNESE